MTDTPSVRSLATIAREILDDWQPKGKGVNYGAVPYLQAMVSMQTVDENYGADPGRHIVNYFLANANAWRGETARRIKAELKAMVSVR